ncbi:MAG TPA: YncE family protein [Verrucomicrobiae bacterium]
MPRLVGFVRFVAAVAGLWVLSGAADAAPPAEPYLSPSALASTRDGKTLFVACATADRVLSYDLEARKITASIPVKGSPSGLAVSADGKQLFVTCAVPEGKVCVIDLAKGGIVSVLPVGHTPMAPVLSPDGAKLFVCNRFNNDLSVLDLKTGAQRRIPAEREPVAAAVTPDGRFLLVANHLHTGAAVNPWVSAVVSVLDVRENKLIKGLLLPDGSGALNDIRVSPDGKYAVVTHVLARFRLPATQLDRGWMNSNAMTLIDLAAMEGINTVLLDDVDRGAANPWGVDWSADGRTLIVALAGTHELSLIDFPGLLAKLARLPATLDDSKPVDSTSASRVRADVPSDLAFLVGLRRRAALPPDDFGPRPVRAVNGKVYAGNFFSDSLTVLDLADQGARPTSLPLGPKPAMSPARQGEFFFNDAGICFQGWQSCATCHPGGGRVDGLNWDLLNDGIGNPKNTRSLLLAHKTPPAMPKLRRSARAVEYSFSAPRLPSGSRL